MASFSTSSLSSLGSERSFDGNTNASHLVSFGFFLKYEADLFSKLFNQSVSLEKLKQLGDEIFMIGVRALNSSGSSSEGSLDLDAKPDVSSMNKDDLVILGNWLKRNAAALSQIKVDKETSKNEAFYNAMGDFFLEQGKASS